MEKEGVVESYLELSISVQSCRKCKKRSTTLKKKVEIEAEETIMEEGCQCCSRKVRVSKFDYSVENHLNAMDRISELCGEAVKEGSGLDEYETQRLSSSITFLREWRVFNYEPRDVKFACEAEGVTSRINLPQFSSATVPQERLHGNITSMEPKDFILYVGGSVWSLDWCPRVHENPESRVKREFIAIAAHPPGSSYHKIGAPLSGKGLVQIWSLLNISEEEGEIPPLEKLKQGRKKSVITKTKPNAIKRPRGRPRKNPLIEHTTAGMDCEDQYIEPFFTQVSENASNLLTIEGVPGYTQEAFPSENIDQQIQGNSIEDCRGSNASNDGLFEISSTSSSIPNDVALPRVVLCLAHNGRVVWDLKWRPSNTNDPTCKYRMGFLAVLLGNGSLEVWEVPHPNTIKVLYTSLHREGTDSRFVKLKPVFKGSILKSGGIQSIPLTVEWSTSPPHEYLLVGCHDGTVAIWKFSENVSSKDTRPLLCFSADTAPIRSVGWAPVESDSEGANVILTVGHGGLKFWDIRDPFRPLWEIHPAPRNINSADWLPDPRCVILSSDDGTMRTLSLTKAAYDVPATGKPFTGTKQQGLHAYFCLSFAIWSVHVSRETGMVAYCGADGNVLRFQLTTKAVDKDHSRNRAPHFLCGSLTEDESIVTINTVIPDTPVPVLLKKSLNKFGDNPIALRDVLTRANQAKREDDDKMEDQPASSDQNLALCYDNDLGVESNPEEETLALLKRQKPSKHAEEKLALVSVDNEARNSQRKEIDKSSNFEALPSKAVAMHKVRWNMNKGSEKWLCSGGAAGIVRCQEIILSDIERKWVMKK
ncbi:uncharacterized protein LOC133788977 [Humulus lupulus]|uniref:uncharacterized protein LOC133788977 n=1 Tax=Humulus lupulus TaxID=3486 RepID=UPI002B413CB0|nr:uncharacterized protein LOC133788977 [Humulus lupulus]XP_062082662.1 uncharacterized protein LOC133788977 [Humulus lupulus]XP_062082663.1 uncharacterized protein LOC133788977 [Humulus lupulus]XP_062082664.1 uncharacterized protein LOC133788977 [Humulus lupulus]